MTTKLKYFIDGVLINYYPQFEFMEYRYKMELAIRYMATYFYVIFSLM